METESKNAKSILPVPKQMDTQFTFLKSSDIQYNSEPQYSLIIRQQPERARCSGISEKNDRKPIEPIPILQLVHSPNSIPSSNLKSSFFFVTAKLIDPKNGSEVINIPDKEESTTKEDKDKKNNFKGSKHNNKKSKKQKDNSFDTSESNLQTINRKAMSGTSIASVYRLQDINQKLSEFFFFNDLNIRVEGEWTLFFECYEIIGDQIGKRASIMSKPFRVYSSRTFPNVTDSSSLSKFFADQGLKVRIRKETKSSNSTLKHKKRLLEIENHRQLQEKIVFESSPHAKRTRLKESHDNHNHNYNHNHRYSHPHPTSPSQYHEHSSCCDYSNSHLSSHHSPPSELPSLSHPYPSYPQSQLQIKMPHYLNGNSKSSSLPPLPPSQRQPSLGNYGYYESINHGSRHGEYYGNLHDAYHYNYHGNTHYNQSHAYGSRYDAERHVPTPPPPPPSVTSELKNSRDVHATKYERCEKYGTYPFLLPPSLPPPLSPSTFSNSTSSATRSHQKSQESFLDSNSSSPFEHRRLPYPSPHVSTMVSRPIDADPYQPFRSFNLDSNHGDNKSQPDYHMHDSQYFHPTSHHHPESHQESQPESRKLSLPLSSTTHDSFINSKSNNAINYDHDHPPYGSNTIKDLDSNSFSSSKQSIPSISISSSQQYSMSPLHTSGSNISSMAMEKSRYHLDSPSTYSYETVPKHSSNSFPPPHHLPLPPPIPNPPPFSVQYHNAYHDPHQYGSGDHHDHPHQHKKMYHPSHLEYSSGSPYSHAYGSSSSVLHLPIPEVSFSLTRSSPSSWSSSSPYVSPPQRPYYQVPPSHGHLPPLPPPPVPVPVPVLVPPPSTECISPFN